MIRVLALFVWLLGAASATLSRAETPPAPYAWSDVGMGPVLLRLPVGSEWNMVDEETGALSVVRMIMSDAGKFERAEYITVDWEIQPEEFGDWLPFEFAMSYLEWEVESIQIDGLDAGLFELDSLEIGETKRNGRPFLFLKNSKRADPAESGYSVEVQELWVTHLADARATGHIYKLFLGAICLTDYCPPEQLDLGPLRQALEISERMTSANVEILLDAQAGAEALALSESLLRNHPYSTELHILAARAEYRIGRDHALNGQHQQAVDAFARALARLTRLNTAKPGDRNVMHWIARAQYRRARALRRLWRVPQAIAGFRAAQMADPKHHASFAGHAYTAFLAGDYSGAEDLFARAVALKNDDRLTLNNLAWMRVAAGLPEYRDPEEAADLVFDAVLEKVDSSYLDTRAAAMFRRGNLEKARDTYIRAIRLDPVYAARLVNDLAGSGCADPYGASPGDILPDYMLNACLDAGYMPFYLSENLRRIDYLAEHDPDNALRHLEVLEAEYPGHPGALTRRAASAGWGRDAPFDPGQD